MWINNADPYFQSTAFICPHCGKNEHQTWDWPKLIHKIKGTWEYHNLRYSDCQWCKWRMVWLESYTPITLSKDKKENRIIFPINYNRKSKIKFLNDTPEIIIDDLKEAASIIDLSPRWSCALLRLALQKFLDEIIFKINWNKKKTVDESINFLLNEKILSQDIINIMHTLRIVWNEAVHPWQMDLKDDKETALKMFDFFNYLIKTIISDNKDKIKIFDMLPENKKKDAIKENEIIAKILEIDVIWNNNKSVEHEVWPSIDPKPFWWSSIPLWRSIL